MKKIFFFLFLLSLYWIANLHAQQAFGHRPVPPVSLNAPPPFCTGGFCDIDIYGQLYSIKTQTFNCASNWQLVLDEEFNTPGLDATKWYSTYPWARYIYSGASLEYNSENNVIVDGSGYLKIEIKQETIQANAVDYRPWNETLEDQVRNYRPFNYTSGTIFSRQTYGMGKYEIRCKIPQINGLWPAFWFYDAGCSREIDMFEFVSNYDVNTYPPDGYESGNSAGKKIIMSYHKDNNNCDASSPLTCNCSSGIIYNNPDNYSDDFHVYTLQWDPYQITWSVDGIVRRVIYGLTDPSTDNPIDECSVAEGTTVLWNNLMPEEPFNIIIGCGVRDYFPDVYPAESGYGWNYLAPPYIRTLPDWIATNGTSNPNLDITLPQYMEIDYIKVWQPVLECGTGQLSTGVINYEGPTEVHDISIEPTSAITVQPSARVYWRAETFIDLGDDFTAEEGSIFTAEIGPCNDAPYLKTDPNNNGEENNLEKPTLQNEIIFISPNPSSMAFLLQLKENTSGEVSIYNSIGQLVYQSTISTPQSVIDLSPHPRGIYFVKVQSGEKIYTEKIVLQ